MTFTRRQLLAAGAAAATTLATDTSLPAPPKGRLRVAALFTEFRFRSHAYNILENFFEPYLFQGKLVDPGVDVVSFYADQFPSNDMARDVSRRLKVPLFKSIPEAMRVGGDKLNVDAVLLIGEHGEYPVNKLGQKMYPRKRFFDAAASVVRGSGRRIPLFNDKHLSYRWDWAKEMYDTARALNMPLLAGSSVPLAERRPLLEIRPGANLSEAIAIHGGGIESYDFHGLEVLFSMIESRQGGESGVTHVELLSKEKLHDAIRSRRWSPELVEAAWKAELQTGIERQPRPGEKPADRKPPNPNAKHPPIHHALCLTHADGLKTTVLQMGSSSNRWSFACREVGTAQPRATFYFNGPWGNRCLFKALSHAIQQHFIQAEPPYPVERTLLVSGILETAMKSHQQGGSRIATPHLKIAYRAKPSRTVREDGSSWKLITRDTPQPADFSPGDHQLLK